MKFHFVVPILIVILLAFLCAEYVYQRYQEVKQPPEGNVYILQQGVYLNSDSIQNIKASYITVQENNKYYTYLGMTLDKKTAQKLKELYEKKDIPVYIKQETITNQEFLNELSQYDILLKNTTQEEEIENILKTILASYEETLIFE